MLDLAVVDNIVDKSGAWYSYGGERIGQGRDNARNFLEENPTMLADIESKILTARGLGRTEPPVEVATDAADDDEAAVKNGKRSSRARAN